MGIVSSIRWVAVSQASRMISQLVSVVVLSRLLPRESYGLMAMAMAVTNLAFLFRNFDTTTVIIQRKELTDSMKSTVYWLNVGLGVFIALVLLAAAVPISLFFEQKELAAVIMMLALVFPISGFGSVHNALLERASSFKVLAQIEVTSSIGALALAIFLALNGAGVWSLVWQMILLIALVNLQLIIRSDWKPRLSFDQNDLRLIFGFSGNLSVFRFLAYIEQNADTMIIGRLLGSGLLGLYSMAVKIMIFPLQNLTSVVSRALLPAFSRNQDSRETMGDIYIRSLTMICIITAPLMTGVFMLREEFVAIVFGPNWSDISVLLEWLAPAGFIQTITSGAGIVFISLNRTRMVLGLGILSASLQVTAYTVGVLWGIEGVVACFFVASLVYLFPCLWFVTRLLKIAPGKIVLEIAKPVAASFAMLLMLIPLRHAAFPMPIPLGFTLASKVVFGAVAYGFFLFVILRQNISDLRALVSVR